MKKSFLFLLVLILIGLVDYKNQPVQFSSKNDSLSQDLKQLEKLDTFGEYSSFLKDLAISRGAEYAYQVLGQAALPPNIDTHLLGHVIGDELYKKQGAEGIKLCTQDFRNACSHTIVIGLLLDRGEEALEEISQACRQAPGGPGAYTMCFHGLGHGVLSYMGYDIEKAIPLCQKTATEAYGYREGIECIGGMIMESISGGFHDLEIWSKMRPRFLNPKNPTRLCEASFMPESAKDMCYTYITPYLFEATGADIGNPGPRDFEKAFKYCAGVPNAQYRLTCYGAFGKEFTTLANNRDIRNVDQMNTAQMQTVYNWCKLANHLDGINACIEHALQSLYWGGENDYHGSIRLCSVISDARHRDRCYETLVNISKAYSPDSLFRLKFCRDLPMKYHGICK